MEGSGVLLKLRRAEDHLEAIEQSAKRFLDSNPYAFAVKPDPKPPKHAVIVEIKHTPPIEWSAVIGDFAHNARCVLDHLVFAASELTPDDSTRGRLAFPIDDSQASATSPRRDAEYQPIKLKGVLPAHRAIVQSHQPYCRSQPIEGDALRILREINNADKHRAIQVVGTIGNITETLFLGPRIGSNFGIGSGAFISFGAGAQCTCVDFGDGVTYSGVGDGVIRESGTKIAELTFREPSQVNMNPKLTVDIQFQGGGSGIDGAKVLPTLRAIRDRVKEVVREFGLLT